MWRILIAAGIVLASALSAYPQTTVKQSGSVTAGHAVRWIANGTIADAGTATQGFLSSIGVTNNGGPGICLNTAAITGPYNQLCLQATTSGNAQISYNAFGGATAGTILFNINGSTAGFPTVLLPVSPGDYACFADVAGNLESCNAPALGTEGYLLSGHGLSPPTFVGFVQTGTGATTKTWSSVLDDWITPEEFGATGDGVANDTAPLQLAINAAQTYGKPVFLSGLYRVCEASGAPGYAVQVTSTIRMEGWGGVSSQPYGQIRPDSGCLGAGVDVINITPSGVNTVNFLAFRNFTIGNGSAAAGRHGIYVDTRVTGRRFGFVTFENLYVLPGAAAAAGFYHDNLESENPSGGMYSSTFTKGIWWDGITMVQTGADHTFNQVLAQGANIGFNISQAAGGTGIQILNSNVANTGGAIKLGCGIGALIQGNSLELLSGAGSSGAIIDLSFGNCEGRGTVVNANSILNFSNSASLLYHIKLSATTTATAITNNSFFTTNTDQIATGAWINNAGARTRIGPQYYQPSTVPAAQTVTNSGSLIEAAQYGQRAISNTNATAVNTDYIIAYTNITAARTITLAPAASLTPGRTICIQDISGLAGPATTLLADPAGSDTVNGSATTIVVVNAPWGISCLTSDGVSNYSIPKTSAWVAYTPTVTASAGTFTSVAGAGQYRMIDARTMAISVSVTVTTVGTASGSIRATLPASVTLFGAQAMGYADNNLGAGNAQANAAIPAIVMVPGAAFNTFVYNANGVVQIQ